MMDVYQRKALWARIAHLMASGATTLARAAGATGNVAARVDRDHGVAVNARPASVGRNSPGSALRAARG
jgi:hypothetical protein